MPNYYVVCPGLTGSCTRHEANDFSSYLENSASYFFLCDSTGATCERSPQNEFIDSFDGDSNTYVACTEPVTGGCSSYDYDGFSGLYSADGYSLPGVAAPDVPTDPVDAGTVQLDELIHLLDDIGEFDPADAGMFVAIYLVCFAMGVGVGEVIGVMKRS